MRIWIMLRDKLDEKEEEIHNYLKKNEEILKKGFGKWTHNKVISKLTLGSDYEVDFIVISYQSATLEISLIELKRANVKIFNKDKTYSKDLNKAINQITAYEEWIIKNEKKFKEELTKRINSDSENLFDQFEIYISKYIVIGRKEEGKEKENKKRAYIHKMQNIDILTYDRLIKIEEEKHSTRIGEKLIEEGLSQNG